MILREDALRHCLESSREHKRPLSLVDCLIRVMLEDTNIRINYLATYNNSDFYDVCATRNIELIPG
jgi:hypothetical protein